MQSDRLIKGLNEKMNFTKNTDKNRIKWVDFSKGVAMLLVVIAHTMRPSGDIQSFGKKTLKSAKSLLIPAVLLYFTWICIEICRDRYDLVFLCPVFWKSFV